MRSSFSTKAVVTGMERLILASSKSALPFSKCPADLAEGTFTVLIILQPRKPLFPTSSSTFSLMSAQNEIYCFFEGPGLSSKSSLLLAGLEVNVAPKNERIFLTSSSDHGINRLPQVLNSIHIWGVPSPTVQKVA